MHTKGKLNEIFAGETYKVSEHNRTHVNDPRGYTVSECINQDVASELVRRWNSHDGLLEALKDIISVADSNSVYFGIASKAITAAIKEQEG